MNEPNANTEVEKLDLSSLDVAELKRQELVELFPEVRTEGGKIDFERLKAVLGEMVDAGRERYGMNWPGKAECMRTIQAPSMGTLLPMPDQSVDWDTTENVIIEGDNLEVLKLLQKSYLGKVKMIYIDPPYNTNGDFIYPDNYSESLETYLEFTGQVDSEGRKFGPNMESDGRFHSKWLSMMYPRLYLARNLLREDGVLAVHIDEHEYPNLQKLLEEVFGETNDLGTVVWDKRNPKGEVVGVAQQHEYIVLFSRNKDAFGKTESLVKRKENADSILSKAEQLIRRNRGVTNTVREEFKDWMSKQKGKFTGGELAYNQIDDAGHVFRTVSMAAPDKPETRSHRPLLHPITGKACPVPAKGWRSPDSTMDELLRSGLIVFGPDESTQPTRKYLLKENLQENLSSLLYYGGSDELEDLPFDNPKPLYVVTRMVEACCPKDGIVMDFFAGSGTVAHAVLSQNDADGFNRRFLLVQLPERTDRGGFSSIAEITRERVRRVASAGRESSLTANAADRGFRSYLLAPSNFIAWDGTASNDAEQLAKQLKLGIDHTRGDRTPQDLLFEVLLKSWGEPALSLKVGEETIEGVRVFSIAEGAFLIYLEEKVSLEFIRALAARKPDRVVMRESAFAGNDQLKTNAVQTFKSQGVTSFKVV